MKARQVNEVTTKREAFSWASLVAQLVKNLPAMQEPWVQFLVQDPPGHGAIRPMCHNYWPVL